MRTETTGVLFILIAICLAGIALAAFPNEWRALLSGQRSRPGKPSESAPTLEEELLARAESNRFERWRFMLRTAWVLVLAGAFLVYLGSRAVNPPNGPQNTVVIVRESPPVPQATSGAGQLWVANVALAVLGGVLICVGWKKKPLVTGMGLASLASGLGGHLFNEIKVDKLIGIDTLLRVGDPRLTLEIKREIQTSGATLQYLGGWQDFPIGKASINLTRERAQNVIDLWQQHKQQGVLFVVGSTDRLPLRGNYLDQYDANVGLARARAESIKEQLCKLTEHDTYPVTADRVLTLVSGPKNTPEQGELKARRFGYPKDRRVDVWAFWNSALQQEDAAKTR